MNLTFGFIAFFISVIIPGILFRRFFYYGEFSKQFDSKDPVLHSIFYSIVPGVCIQVICFVIGDKMFSFGIENTEIFNIFKDFVYSGEKEINDNTKTFLKDGLSTFVYYSLLVFLISILLGHGLSRFIRWCGLDKRFKILKYKNQWFYIFSGELLQFEKFEFGRNITTNNFVPHDHKISITYADILVDNTEGMRELYSGYVVDYDLKTDDISQLERIYLLDAYRYKKIEKEDSSKEDLINSPEENEDQAFENEIQSQIDYKSRIRKKIPSDVFIVSGKDIININLTYVFSEKKHQIRETIKQKIYGRLDNTYIILCILVIVLHFVYNREGSRDSWFISYMIESSIWVKLLVVLTISQFFALFIPTYSSNEKKYLYSIVEKVGRAIVFIVLYLTLCELQNRNELPENFPLFKLLNR